MWRDVHALWPKTMWIYAVWEVRKVWQWMLNVHTLSVRDCLMRREKYKINFLRSFLLFEDYFRSNNNKQQRKMCKNEGKTWKRYTKEAANFLFQHFVFLFQFVYWTVSCGFFFCVYRMITIAKVQCKVDQFLLGAWHGYKHFQIIKKWT